MQNTKCAMYIGSNAAEAQPVSMLHMLHAKEIGAKMIVVDPRFTRTAAKADEYVRIRSGSDIAFMFGMLHHIFKNGWEDKAYIQARVYGMDKVRDECLTKWTPDKVEEVCGVPEARVLEIATLMAKNRPSTVVWCMGQTQHTIGNAMVRASCICQLALGNIRVSGGGANMLRGHANGREGNGRGDEEARHPRGDRSVSIGDRRDGGNGAAGRRLPVARLHAVRDFGLGDGLESFVAMARARDQPAIRIADRSGADVRIRQKIRLRQGARQELRNLEARRRPQIRRANARVDTE